MLQIHVPAGEYWDEASETFLHTKDATLRLEHSLISISKWESKWCIPFLSSNKTPEQLIDYIRCMSLDSNVDDEVLYRLSSDNVKAINDYIAAPMTATTITESHETKKTNEFVTSELIYYWMIQYNIPVSFEKWHLNRLIMLIRVCSEKAKPARQMTRNELLAKYRAVNAARRAKYRKK